MTIYILHEIYNTFDSDHEPYTDYDSCIEMFNSLRKFYLNESKNEQYAYPIEVYMDEGNELSFINNHDEHVRLFITEHVID